MIILQERDRKIQRLCFEQQFILSEHALKYFSKGGYRACQTRLQELIREGYLFEDKSKAVGKKSVYRTTKLGAAAALESGAAAVTQVGSLNQLTLAHDAIVTSVRQRLEEFWDAQFVCERAIKEQQFDQVPDGIFVFPSGLGIAIEIENTPKGPARFVRLLSRWEDVPEIAFVLYVATTDALYKSLQSWIPQGPATKPIGAVHWDDLKCSVPTVWTPRGYVRLFDQRTYG